MNKYDGFVGKVLDGRYKILELVGLGGMACVLKAQDLVMNRIVAIKILNDEYNGNEAAEARFIDESKAVAMLSNKNIVGVYDVAIYPDIKYIVMEYLDGITLREYLDNKKVLDWKEASIYILQILHALEHAHSKNIIHRDIKPQNVMLMKNGDIKVTDFGIAKLPDSVSEQKDEKAVGTVYYISPEQACGKETDYYSDIYSVGIMFYEAVTGTLPFTAETPMEIAMMQVNDEPVHPRDIVLDIPVGISQIILKAMEKSPDERFQSAHAMAKAIEWVIKYPDVIFAMNASVSDNDPINGSNFVSIDMISTAELEPYGDEEISETIGKGKKEIKQGTDIKKTEKNTKKSGNTTKVVKKKRKRSTAMFPIICGVSIALLLVIVVLIITLIFEVFNKTEEPVNEAVFPDLVNTYYTDDLENNLLNGKVYGASFKVDHWNIINDPSLENNLIISTEPEGGHIGKPKDDDKYHFTQITYNVTQKVILPNLCGKSKTTAEVELKNLGLKVEFVETSDTDSIYRNANQVIETSPEKGTEIEVGQTVTVTIFKQENNNLTSKMPDLTGMTLGEAKKFAETYAKYQLTVTEEPVAGGNNRVVSQSIPAGEVHAAGTNVDITIAVPLTTFVMPDLIGKKKLAVTQSIMIASPDQAVKINYHYFVLNEEVAVIFEPDMEKVEDLSSLLKLLRECEATQLTDYDGIGTVYFQSVPMDTECDIETTQIDIVFITYTSGIAIQSPLDPLNQNSEGPVPQV